jgi:hypothetical protein
MAVRLTRGEIQLLKELKAAGGHGRRVTGTSSTEIAHLVGAQCIKRFRSTKLYVITGRGRQAFALATAAEG